MGWRRGLGGRRRGGPRAIGHGRGQSPSTTPTDTIVTIHGAMAAGDLCGGELRLPLCGGDTHDLDKQFGDQSSPNPFSGAFDDVVSSPGLFSSTVQTPSNNPFASSTRSGRKSTEVASVDAIMTGVDAAMPFSAARTWRVSNGVDPSKAHLPPGSANNDSSQPTRKPPKMSEAFGAVGHHAFGAFDNSFGDGFLSSDEEDGAAAGGLVVAMMPWAMMTRRHGVRRARSRRHMSSSQCSRPSAGRSRRSKA